MYKFVKNKKLNKKNYLVYRKILHYPWIITHEKIFFIEKNVQIQNF